MGLTLRADLAHSAAVTAHETELTIPPEWHPNEACWLAWPHMAAEWGGDLEPPRRELAALAVVIADVDPATGQPRGERVELLVSDQAGADSASAAVAGASVVLRRIPYGDIWLRDTGPMFGFGADGELRAACFGWNGWGGKYVLPNDADVGERIAAAAGVPATRHGFVLEGGAVEVDGEGTVLTTRQCLLNPNRNPGPDGGGPTEAAAEAALAQALGARRVLWLDRGLIGDHTDGHVDTLARFVAPGVVVCMAPGPGDPNRDALDEIARDLARFRDARGQRLEVVTIPSPGVVRDPDGALMPASYANFYLGNRRVVVPTYGVPADDAAVAALAAVFPGREVIGLSSRAILLGGGAFHCVSRQQPRAASV